MTERGIYFISGLRMRAANPLAAISFFGFVDRRVKDMAPLHNDPGFGSEQGLSVSPDGKWLVYSGGFFGSDIMMMDNFR